MVEDLPVGVRQRVEIIKTLYRKSDIVILDEPSAVLTPQETEELFAIMRSLTAGGTSIIFITHKLGEVMEVADRITVLRRGRVVGTTTPAESDEEELAAMMVGRAVQLVVDKDPALPGEPVSRSRTSSCVTTGATPRVDHLSLTVRAGETVAIAGCRATASPSWSRRFRAPCGGRRHDPGGGNDVVGASPREIFQAGVAHVPRIASSGMIVASPWPRTSPQQLLEPAVRQRLNLDGEAIVANADAHVAEFDIRTRRSKTTWATCRAATSRRSSPRASCHETA